MKDAKNFSLFCRAMFAAFTPDSKSILFTRTTGDFEPQRFELWCIPAKGGEPLKSGIAMEGLRHLRVHPDGQRIVFDGGHIQDEVWVLEDFLPEPKRTN